MNRIRSHLRRSVGLGWFIYDEIRAHRTRSGLLVVGVAVSVVVFLGAVALAESNADGLRETVRRTQGAENTYLLRIDSGRSSTWDVGYMPELRRVVEASGAIRAVVLQRFDLDQTLCSGVSADSLVVVDGDVGEVLSAGFERGGLRRASDDRAIRLGDCPLAGLPMAPDRPRPATSGVSVAKGEVMADRSDATSSLAGASRETEVLLRYRAGSSPDLGRLRRSATALVRSLAALDDVPAAALTIDRVDTAGNFVDAQRSARVVMFAFAGSTVTLSCMAIALTYLSAAQQRSGSIGLARAAGALRAEVVAVVVGEIAAVVASGAALGVVCSLLLEPAISGLADGPARVLSGDRFIAMVGVLSLSALLAAAGPVVRVLRLDVADVLTS